MDETLSEEEFLRAINEHSGDESAWLVYADWLEEQGDGHALAKAEFLRLAFDFPIEKPLPGKPIDDQEADDLYAYTLLAGPGGEMDPKADLALRQRRLRQLAGDLAPRWLAQVSKLAIENCRHDPKSIPESPDHFPFYYLCHRQWQDLLPTDTPMVRFCDLCQKEVFYCQSIEEAYDCARWGNCVAVSLQEDREPHDLQDHFDFTLERHIADNIDPDHDLIVEPDSDVYMGGI